MKKLLIIAAMSLLPIKILANIQEIEQAIFDSRPQKLEQLLRTTTLNEHEIQNFVILAEQRHKMRTSVWRENPQPGEHYTIAGVAALIPSAVMLLLYLIITLEHRDRTPLFISLKSLNEEPANRFTILKNKIFNPFTAILSSLLAISAGSFYLAYKENKKPGWRSKSEEEWDAFKVKLILLTFMKQNTELFKQTEVNQ